MNVNTVNLNGQSFKLFEVRLFKGTKKETTEVVAEEKLERFIEGCILRDRYSPKVRQIDERYGYFVPQDIADRGIESEIRESIEDVYS